MKKNSNNLSILLISIILILVTFILIKLFIGLYNNNRITMWGKSPCDNNNKIKSEIYCFRVNGKDEWAIVYGNPHLDKYPLVRIQSQCVSGIELDDLECDCKDNLQYSKKLIQENPNGGILFILNQDGRSLGGIEKLKEKSLRQIEGLEMDLILKKRGHGFDERNYDFLPEALKIMGFSNSIILVTRYPGRITDLKKSGINIVSTVKYPYNLNEYNEKYIKMKKCIFGFDFETPDCK
uniref:GTP cyclohydrolase II domain-containing protein n=1 Tax=viral metagenome TaxID=1070528 RepID=A0A6C0KS98_9ZZZZ